MTLPPNHADRLVLADEVHARPPTPVETPSRASYVALQVDADARERELAHLKRLCDRFDVAAPTTGATHFMARLGAIGVKWERHGEFSGYTFIAEGRSASPFAEPPADILPPGWLGELPGATVAAAHAEIVVGDEALWASNAVQAYFDGHIVVGAAIADGAGRVYTDFKLHADGFSRFVMLSRSLTPRQAGRMLQRLFEIEAYRMLALLALPIARGQAPAIGAIEKALAGLTDAIAKGADDDEALLGELSRLAAEVERGIAASQFRFGACRAYSELVGRRIAELRESRLPGLQTIEEFMARRFTPAVATCATTSQRLHDLSDRVSQASALLSTRVNIAHERQNQKLLASMDRRAKLQLRLQQTVEGLSVAAITYYVVGLVGYLGKALKAAGLGIDPDLAAGLSVPVIAGLVLLALRRVRRHLAERETAV